VHGLSSIFTWPTIVHHMHMCLESAFTSVF
jgi:hypothetical protein